MVEMFGTTFVNLPQITLVKPIVCVWVRVGVLLDFAALWGRARNV